MQTAERAQCLRATRVGRASASAAAAVHRGVHSAARLLTALADLNFRRRRSEEEEEEIMALEMLAALQVRACVRVFALICSGAVSPILRCH